MYKPSFNGIGVVFEACLHPFQIKETWAVLELVDHSNWHELGYFSHATCGASRWQSYGLLRRWLVPSLQA